MLYWALVFFIAAIIAAIFGFTDVSAELQTVAMWVFWVAIILFLITLLTGVFRKPRR